MSRCRGLQTSCGFTLVEVLVSLAILISALVAVANLFAIGLRANLAARTDSFTTVLAAQKMEALLAEPRATPSPPDSLVRDVSGFSEYLGRDGTVLPAGRDAPAGSLFRRRWAIRASDSDPAQSVIIEVVATTTRLASESAGPAPPYGSGVHLVTIRRRGPS